MYSTAKSTFNCQRPSSWTLWPLLSASPEGIVRLKHALTMSKQQPYWNIWNQCASEISESECWAEPRTGSFSSTLRVTRACIDDKRYQWRHPVQATQQSAKNIQITNKSSHPLLTCPKTKKNKQVQIACESGVFTFDRSGKTMTEPSISGVSVSCARSCKSIELSRMDNENWSYIYIYDIMGFTYEAATTIDDSTLGRFGPSWALLALWWTLTSKS